MDVIREVKTWKQAKSHCESRSSLFGTSFVAEGKIHGGGDNTVRSQMFKFEAQLNIDL